MYLQHGFLSRTRRRRSPQPEGTEDEAARRGRVGAARQHRASETAALSRRRSTGRAGCRGAPSRCSNETSPLD
ncbi:hypothetical protein EVAR_20740_1 [Eumeta japonica]|uniref:Uncharacterized protein n=1 Tax=Eumeta variegata TaxID=151549 RepID=A0A4C1VAM9_EUMVA|nr:hypothetical protein EVAR_20740_1 [Eumeta japonica]